MFNETFYVCRKFAAALEVPEGDAAELIIIVPVVEELLDAVLAGLVLGLLRIREFEGRDAAYLERLDVGVVAGWRVLCPSVSPTEYPWTRARSRRQ